MNLLRDDERPWHWQKLLIATDRLCLANYHTIVYVFSIACCPSTLGNLLVCITYASTCQYI